MVTIVLGIIRGFDINKNGKIDKWEVVLMMTASAVLGFGIGAGL